MAAGFKSATVRAADVPATQTDFPSYVDLARIGITTLAEAESVRVYADSAKTTEWAREIVSLTEMHVKVPSLTSTVVMYVDWDGVRADYAVSATYGRNAVWRSEYAAVYHFATGLTDSTSNAVFATNNGSTNASGGKIGNHQSFNGSQSFSIPLNPSGTSISITGWIELSSTSDVAVIFEQSANYNSNPGAFITYLNGNGTQDQSSFIQDYSMARFNNVAANSYNHHAYVYDSTRGGTLENLPYINGVLQSYSSPSTHDNTGNLLNSTLHIFSRNNTQFYTTGYIADLRIYKGTLSANWITTEHNNQNAEATFWGTWADAGGSPAQTARRGVVMMM